MFVHAHPDDESVGTGATMAYYAATDAHVTLVTCTLGEEGEIHVPELALLEATQADQLGGYRITELATACASLGVTDHRFLGGAGRYRDSGMMGLPTNDHPRAFWRADLDTAAGHLVEVIREVRPQVLVTYDPNGFYGHPDHIQAHRVAMRAVELTDADQLPFGTPDDQIAAAIHANEFAERKTAALKAHATQIPPNSWLYTIASNFGAEFMGVEHYTLARGAKGPGTGRYGWEGDLFAGLDIPAVLV